MSNEHLAPRFWPHDSLRTYWESGLHQTEGATQPWVAALLYDLMRALDVRIACELGCWRGVTSAWMALAIEANGGGTLTIVDHQADVLAIAKARVEALGLQKTKLVALAEPTLAALPSLDRGTRFIFLDDDKARVAEKLDTIQASGIRALVAIHDIEAVHPVPPNCLVLDIPPLHGTGALGLVNV